MTLSPPRAPAPPRRHHIVSPASPPRRHLRAALGALAITLLLLAGVAGMAVFQLDRHVHALAPVDFLLKGQDMAIQRAAFEQPDLLPFYGSSEMAEPIPDKASLFFADYPTQFEVFPVGRAGCTSLTIAQKLAALGPALRGKKIAISISPVWFFNATTDPSHYAGNFNGMAAGELAFSSALSPALKRDAARRMLEFPQTLEKHPMLAWTLRRLAGDTVADRCLYRVVWPLGKMQNAIQRAQDLFESGLFMITHADKLHTGSRPSPKPIDWTALFAAVATEGVTPPPPESPLPKVQSFRAVRLQDHVADAREWDDFELLLRTLHELGAEPLLLSMPLHGSRFDRIGVAAASRRLYVERLRELAARYAMPLRDFQDHEGDPDFLDNHYDHLTVKGWLYFNQALDDFYHDRLVNDNAQAF